MFSEEDKKLYDYAIKIILQWIINLVAIITIAIIFKMIKECLILLLPFFVLRKFTGGFHCKSFAMCFLSSITILSFCLLSIKYQLFSKNIVLIFLTVSITFITIFSPVQNINKPLSAKETSVYRKISLLLLLLLIILLAVIERLLDNSLFYPLSYGIIITGIMLIVSKTEKILKEKQNEKRKIC